MRADYDKLQQQGVPILVIIPTDIDKARGYWTRNNIPVTGLVDPERKVMTEYGQEYNLPKLGWMPATIALDKDHKVSYVHYGDNQRDIATSSEILGLMSKLAA